MEYSIFINIGAAFFIGYALGYAIKLGLKFFIFIFGVFLMGIFFLQSQNVITLHPENFNNLTAQILTSIQNFLLYYYNILSNYPGEGIGAAAGFVVGLRKR